MSASPDRTGESFILTRRFAAPRAPVFAAFSDAAGGITRHPFVPRWPQTTLSTTTLADDGDGTLMSLQWQALNTNEDESKDFDGAHDGMRQGWSGTMDQLDAHLAAAQGRQG